jgi:aminopeptidase YwaD
MSNPIARNLLALSLIVAATACAPRTATVADPASVTAPAAASLITQESVRAHMEFLASDALNGRGSGTRDEWIAVTYIASQLRRWGLEPMGDDGGYV